MSKNRTLPDALGKMMSVKDSVVEDAHFAMDGQKLTVKGWVNDREMHVVIGEFSEAFVGPLTEAIVGVLNTYEWKVAEPIGDGQ